MIHVLNKKTYNPNTHPVFIDPSRIIYVGRPSILGNIHTIDDKHGRDQVIAMFKYDLGADEEQSKGSPYVEPRWQAMVDLAKRIQAEPDQEWGLMCWCAPQPCHAHVIKEVLERLIAKASKIATLDTKHKVMAVTGHRPDKLGGYSQEAYAKLIAFAARMLRFYNPSEVITGMAMGWDMAVAAACTYENVPFIAAVPFLGQESRWTQEWRATYEVLLKRAKRVQIVCAGDYAVWKMQARNQWMVDNADFVVALWNGSEGGTANCVAYAQQKNKPIKQVWASWQGR